jgi:Skp family chaperone for outer membrane proteins
MEIFRPKKMNKIFIALIIFLTLFLISDQAVAQESCGKLAKINYRNLESLLQEIVLSKPQHVELNDSFKKAEKENQSQQNFMMKRIMEAQSDGKVTLNMKDMLKDDGRSDFFTVKTKVEELARDEFRKIIATSFSDSYDIIIEENWNKEILYSKCPIQDITAQIRQHILTQEHK